MSTPRFLGLAGLVWSFAAFALALPRLATPDRPDPHSLVLPPTPMELAVTTLRAAPSFDAAQVGYAGIAPPEVLAWRLILQHPKRDSIFSSVLSNASLPGQLYALAGLYFADGAAYRRGARELRQRGEKSPQPLGASALPARSPRS
jgi:hypothetical protein